MEHLLPAGAYTEHVSVDCPGTDRTDRYTGQLPPNLSHSGKSLIFGVIPLVGRTARGLILS